jgi:quercetin dioxygenase-like cupin family protein
MMRVLLTGVDAEGRSHAISHATPEFVEAAPGFSFADVFTIATPPGPRPEGHAELHDLGIAPGAVHWMLVDYAPGASTPHHCTDSYDFEVVLAGSIWLTLDDGVHHLEAGDIVIMTGVDHAWRAGPEGCRLSVCCLGTPPLE